MKKWIIGCVVAVLMAMIVAAGFGYLGYAKLRDWNAKRISTIKARQELVASRIAQRRSYLESALSDEIRDSIPADFYTYDGFRDWWRLPLVFPYQLMCIDTRDRASLENFNPNYPVTDPNKSSSRVFGDITRVATDNTIFLFETQSGSTTSYGMLRYRSGKRSDFGKEAEMWNAAQEAGFSGSHALVGVEDLFSAYYDWNKTFVEQSRTGDVPLAAPEE